MIAEVRAVPPFYKNGYIVACARTHEAVMIDPGDEVDQLLEVIASQSLTVISVLLTHAHVDHVTGVGTAKRATGAPVYLHRDDQLLYDRAPQQAAFFGSPVNPCRRSTSTRSRPADVLWRIEVRCTTRRVTARAASASPSVLRRAEARSLRGRSLFAGSIGRTDLPGATTRH